ncbi:hypothetical protein CB1_000658007 [Camelus ferus]|nr:hypothetical protein CB1_000658007 [Camelus ferus]
MAGCFEPNAELIQCLRVMETGEAESHPEYRQLLALPLCALGRRVFPGRSLDTPHGTHQADFPGSGPQGLGQGQLDLQLSTGTKDGGLSGEEEEAGGLAQPPLCCSLQVSEHGWELELPDDCATGS